METYKHRTITTRAKAATNGVLYWYEIDGAPKGCGYSTRARAIEAAKKFIDRLAV